MSRTEVMTGGRAAIGAGIPTDKPESIQEELNSILKAITELRNRLVGLADVIVGPTPTDAGQDSIQPGTLRAQISGIGEMIKMCHGELTRTTRHLDI